MAAIKVGHVTVTEAFDLNRPHESAAQYHRIRVEPGAYPVEVRDSRYGGKYAAVAFSGIVLASGYAGDSNVRHRDLEGATDTVVMQPYKYELRAGMYHGCKVTLDDPTALDAAQGV